jgi:hypothetical protein
MVTCRVPGQWLWMRPETNSVSDGELAAVLAFAPDRSYLGSIGGESPAARFGSMLQAPLGCVSTGSSVRGGSLSGLLVFR